MLMTWDNLKKEDVLPRDETKEVLICLCKTIMFFTFTLILVVFRLGIQLIKFLSR